MATTPKRPCSLGAVEVGTDVVELAVVPARAVGLLQGEDRDVVLGCERLHVTAEAVADLLEQRRRRDREAEVLGEEGHHLAAHLEVGDVGVQKSRSMQSTSRPHARRAPR